MSGTVEVERQQFLYDLLRPESWLAKANALISSAARFEHQLNEAWTNVFVSPSAVRLVTAELPVYLMLSAYAVENLLKAFLVRRKQVEFRAYVERRHALPRELKSHDLCALASQSGAQSVQLSYREDLLRRMVRSAVWYGRYPVPLAFSQREPEIAYLRGSDVDEVRSLVVDLQSEFVDGNY